MAGIGFRIQKILDRDTYLSTLQGFLLGAFVSCGPLLIIVISIGALSLISSHSTPRSDVILFRTTLVYVYAISLVLSGGIQLTVTRFIADCLFSQETDRVTPTLSAVLVFSSIIAAILGFIVFGPAKLGVWYTYRAVALMVLVTNVFMVMSFITATREYVAIAFAYVFGSVAAVIGGYFLGQRSGIIGYLEGYAIGQAMIMVTLIMLVVREFPCRKTFDFGFLDYYRRFPELPITGVFFSLGVWADKIVMWWSNSGENIHGWFYTYDLYDSANFLAYLTVVPALTMFLLRVETSFYLKYRGFYAAILHQGTLERIEAAHEELSEDLTDGVRDMVRMQLVITILCVLFCLPMMKMFLLSPLQWAVFRVSLVGVLLLVITQSLVIILLYFELRIRAMWVSIIFCVANFTLTWLCVRLGFQWMGYGFTIASLISVIIGYLLINRDMRSLVFMTFSSQPIPKSAPSA